MARQRGRAIDRRRLALRRLSLRARLLLGLVVVAAVGLIVADVVVYGQVEGYLNSQVDQELQTAQPVAVRALRTGVIDPNTVPPGTYIALLSPTGSFVTGDPPTLRLAISKSTLSSAISSVGQPASSVSFTATATAGGSGTYRGLASPVLNLASGGATYVEVVAIPLSQVNETLDRLLLIDLEVTAAVLAVLILLGYFVVRVSLRPLSSIEETAGAIAGGDLTRRIEDADNHTEIGRLGASLNTMLAQIENAFTLQQASEDRLRQFLADASHELRTPVTSIRGYAELFRRGAASRPEDLSLALRRIEDESARMGLLVDDLLLLARLDQGRPLEKNVVDLAAIATDAAADAQMLAPDRSITVDAPFPIQIEGDEQRLHQVAANLIGNAMQHTPDDVPIEVRVTADGTSARLSVRDEGPGLAPEHATRVFERFYRADAARARGSGGSGLGLAIVASIAEAHGGKARVETAPGNGATFIVELPIVQTGHEEGSVPKQTADPSVHKAPEHVTAPAP